MSELFWVVVGMAMLVGGGDLLVRGASGLAQRAGVSPLVIGMTVVAFGTSAPELAVNVTASISGESAISFGNIVGSNIANIGLALGIAALFRPIAVRGTMITREIPMMLLATVAAVVLGGDRLLRGVTPQYDRADGLILLLFFAVFIYYTVCEVLQRRGKDVFTEHVVEMETSLEKSTSVPMALGMSGAGLALLLIGGRVTVEAAVGLAMLFKVPEVIIGLTVVAVGTSLPEIATSVVATWRGQTDIAMGNVVGSNIFNLLFILGVSATLAPVGVPAGGTADLLTMTFLSVILLPLALINGQRFFRLEGGVLLVGYVFYTFWRVLAAG